jgi:Transposase and inactivated derivatives
MNTLPIDISKYVLKYLSRDEEAMRSLMAMFLNKVMQAEADQQAGCQPYERSPDRLDYRNGYKLRQLTTRFGKVVLQKPQLRNSEFETVVIGKYGRVEKSLVNAVVESYTQGLSTRNIESVVACLGVESLSKSTVSRMAEELDAEVNEFLSRPIERAIPYLFIDATYLKVRDKGRYVNKAVFLAAGIREDGFLEVLGVRMADNEGEEFWHAFLEELKDRGLRGVQLVISDGHRGIKKAVETTLLGSSWQICHVHFRRTAMKSVPMKQRKAVNALLRTAMESPSKLQEHREWLRKNSYEKVVTVIDRYQTDLYNYLAAPKHMHTKLRTTNTLERTNAEIKRRSRVVGAFPNEQSAMRLVISILIDRNEEWITDKRHIDMERNDDMNMDARH